MKTLTFAQITTAHGNCDIQHGVPNGYSHIKQHDFPGKKMKKLMRLVRCRGVKAMLGFHGHYPIIFGYVVKSSAEAKIKELYRRTTHPHLKPNPLQATM
jgi:hypothetical protein